MDSERLKAITLYLNENKYIKDTSKSVKRIIRKQAISFELRDGVLFHKSKDNSMRVVDNSEEQHRILTSAHDDLVGGGHFGQATTYNKIAERFWWKNLQLDTRNFVRACDRCQKANPCNRPPPATLHPITVS